MSPDSLGPNLKHCGGLISGTNVRACTGDRPYILSTLDADSRNCPVSTVPTLFTASLRFLPLDSSPRILAWNVHALWRATVKVMTFMNLRYGRSEKHTVRLLHALQSQGQR